MGEKEPGIHYLHMHQFLNYIINVHAMTSFDEKCYIARSDVILFQE